MTEHSIQNSWRVTLEKCIADLHDCGLHEFASVTVLAETASTQDVAVGAHSGSVITTLRQTRGRGRQGRAWMDDHGEGLAATFVIPPDRSARLAIAAALATAQVVSAVLPQSVRCGIKWPNDILVDRRKVAGVLVEQNDAVARIGIGINVHQTEWPVEIKGRAISLVQTGVNIRREDILALLIQALAKQLRADNAMLTDAFAQYDLLRNSRVTLDVCGITRHGRILEIRPLETIKFKPDDESMMIIPVAEATISSILEWPENAKELRR